MKYQKWSNTNACVQVFLTIVMGSMEIFSVFFNHRDAFILIIGLIMISMGIWKIHFEADPLLSTLEMPKAYHIFNTTMSAIMFLFALAYAIGLII